jgi:hypoxanthine phosphoribosyltransferase
MEQLASAKQIDLAISAMASTIIAQETERPLFVALLRGAVPFASKLMFEIARQSPDFHPELDYMNIHTYGDGRTAQQPTITSDISTEVNERSVIILDDVLDTGATTAYVRELLLTRGATDVRLAVLVEKDIEREIIHHADYVCFHAGHEWLIGMGMDNATVAPEASRWDDAIWQIK